MARAQSLTLILVIFSFASPLSSDELDRDLARARQHIQAERFDEAIRILDEALPRADSLPAEVQPQARTALHFYAAVAASGLGREEEALSHLQEVLRLSPEIRAVDPGKYDARFVALFARARAELVGAGRFEELYPSFSSVTSDASIDLSSVGVIPALEVLATRAEKREWQSARLPEERERFMVEFWRVRDQTPNTARNEFRETFERRVAFADSAFGSIAGRGALSDRGRVYLLLGEPAQVRRRAIDSNDPIVPFNTNSIGIEVGTIEYWFYMREQLPVAYSKPTVTYRFVSHQGVGHFALQKDGMAMNILAMSASATTGE